MLLRSHGITSFNGTKTTSLLKRSDLFSPNKQASVNCSLIPQLIKQYLAMNVLIIEFYTVKRESISTRAGLSIASFWSLWYITSIIQHCRRPQSVVCRRTNQHAQTTSRYRKLQSGPNSLLMALPMILTVMQNLSSSTDKIRWDLKLAIFKGFAVSLKWSGNIIPSLTVWRKPVGRLLRNDADISYDISYSFTSLYKV